MELLHIIAIVTLQGTCKCIILKMSDVFENNFDFKNVILVKGAYNLGHYLRD